ncbi:MAG TPA: hypothetical protein VK195_04240 [Burkholderiaceae bacterium]|nr:hypothetical protein [Burkholderiaceae bacterium]
MNGIRWLMAWFSGLLLLPATVWGVLLVDRYATRWWCPPEQLLSGVCMAEGFGRLLLPLQIATVALGAALAVLAPSLMAPRERRLVSAAMLSLGTSLCVVAVVAAPPSLVFAVPAVLGGCLARWVGLRTGRLEARVA